MANTVEYQISITKTGDGAVTATQELKNLQSAAAAATGSSNTMSGALRDQRDASRLAGESVKVLNETCLLAGMSGFPQLGMAVGAVRSELALARTAARLTGESLAAINVIVVGLVAVVGTGIAAWSQYRAELQETKSIADKFATEDKIADRLKDQVRQLQLLGKLTQEQAAAMNKLLAAPSYENIRAVQTELRPIVGDEKQIEAARRMNDVIRDMNIEMMSGFEKERAEAEKNFAARMDQLKKLKAASGEQITSEQFVSASIFALGEKTAALKEISARETAQKLAEISRQQKAEEDAADQLYAEMQRERAAETARMIREFNQEQTLDALQSTDDRITIAEREYREKLEFNIRLRNEGRITAEQLIDFDNQALISKLQNTQRFEERYTLHTMAVEEMQIHMVEQFAGGMARAFVDFASGTKSAEEAFRAFAASFLEMIAQMILQQMILNAIKSMGWFGGGGTKMAADGGMFPRYAASGLSGVSEVSAATYFPRFNVVAGEAGREMLTVLAKPRMMSIGGMDAVVGNAGNNRLAIMDADQMAERGRVGGLVEIKVSMEPGLKAEIIQTAVKGATVQVEQDLTRDTPIARNTKSLTA